MMNLIDQISEHITRLHRYIPPGISIGTPITEDMVQSIKSNNIAETSFDSEVILFLNRHQCLKNITNCYISESDPLQRARKRRMWLKFFLFRF
jgi:hypothetical protein